MNSPTKQNSIDSTFMSKLVVPTQFTDIKEYALHLKTELLTGKSASRIAHDLNVNRRTVIYHMHALKLTQFNTHQKPTLTEDWFDKIDTPEKAYFLGFLAGDGYFGKTNFTVELSLGIKDANILEIFSQFIGCNVRYSRIVNKQQRRFPQASLSFANKRLYQSLLTKLGKPAKEDRQLPGVSKALIPYLIRGFFDAEGMVSHGVRKNGRNWQKVSFTSQLKMLEAVQRHLLKLADISSVIRPKTGEQCYVLEFAAKQDVIKFIDFIYNPELSNNIGLVRKQKKIALLRPNRVNSGKPAQAAIPSEVKDTSLKRVETSGEV